MLCRIEVEPYALVTENVCAFDHFDSPGYELIVLFSNADVIAALLSSQTWNPPPSLPTKELARYGGTWVITKVTLTVTLVSGWDDFW